ncbi:MAG TPA: DUF3309 family protein [Rhabdochlamydiaceae bacterium]|nr:DUF3309 family protein [Rhabdochlamydiaceae bacterium]
MGWGLILLIILLVVLVAILPTWRYSMGWGFGPFGFVGLILIVLLFLLYFNILPLWEVEVDDDSIKIERKY